MMVAGHFFIGLSGSNTEFNVKLRLIQPPAIAIPLAKRTGGSSLVQLHKRLAIPQFCQTGVEA
jgi:hypothetical protein